MPSIQTNWSALHACSKHTGFIPKHSTIYLLCSGEKVNAMCKKIYVKMHIYMCVYVYFLCIYILTYSYSLMRRSLIFCDSFMAELCCHRPHTSSEIYLVAEALLRALSNVFSSVYYCHWKTTLVFFSARTFIGSLFLPKHSFLPKHLEEFKFQLLSTYQNLLKLLNSIKNYNMNRHKRQSQKQQKDMFVSGTLYSSLRNLDVLSLSCVFHI